MMKYHRMVNVSTRVFLGLSALLYILFTLCDIFFDKPDLSSGLKFTSICLCFLITLIRLFCDPKNPDCKILAAALLFTVTADVFLLLTDKYPIGVLSFCVVQMIYLYRIQTIKKGKLYIHLLIRFAGSAGIVGILAASKIDVDFLLCITVFYFISFVGNIGLLIKIQGKDSLVHLGLFLTGMILFILCDVSVGLYNMTSYVDLSGEAFKVVEEIAAFGMWGFYLPGQVCIALSTKMK